jgi:uncharacterized protein GlcG (DUF336 family)
MTRPEATRRWRNRKVLTEIPTLILVLAILVFSGLALAFQSGPSPVINPSSCSFNPATGTLMIKGQNFQPGATVLLANTSGQVSYSRVKIKGHAKIVIAGVNATDTRSGLDVSVINPDGGASPVVHIDFGPAAVSGLTQDDVKTIIAQAVAQAQASGLKATIAVVDKEGNVLGEFAMQGAPANTKVGILESTHRTCPASETCGLEGQLVPSSLAAISKAGTGAFLSSQGEALTTRTASFIIQEHFPPGVSFQAGGPLFGVQFSQLPCGDINPVLPLGLAGDPGGVPLYKDGKLAGGIGVEGDGIYGVAVDPRAGDQPVEELVAVAGTRGFEAPSAIRGDQLIVNGIRFPFVNTPMPPAAMLVPFNQLQGSVISPIKDTPPSRFTQATLNGIQGRVDSRFFPFRGGSSLTKSDVETIITQAAQQCIITRAAIRQPLGSAAQVNITVADVDGTILGIFSLPDAPVFGFDVSAQKARTAAFYSSATAATRLLAAEGGRFAHFVAAANADGLKLDGSVAFTDRAGGFLSRPFFPDGIDGTANGPFSKPIEEFSPFNDGLQLDLVTTALFKILAGQSVTSCTDIPGLNNGIQIFPGSVPLYRGGKLVGAIGISGDGVDQDDIIATMGSAGFEAPMEIRSDQVFVRGVRLPYVKFPRHPDL